MDDRATIVVEKLRDELRSFVERRKLTRREKSSHERILLLLELLEQLTSLER